VGRCAVVPPSLRGANVNRALAVLKLNPRLDANYVCLVIRSPLFQDRFATEKIGSAQARINIGDLRRFPFPLAPAQEQEEIVRRVGALFKLADRSEEKLAAARQRVDALTQAVPAKAFRGELVPTEAELASRENRAYEPAADLLARIRAEREQQPANGKPKRPRKPRASET